MAAWTGLVLDLTIYICLQVYPTGEKSNNNMYASTVAGTVTDIKEEKRVFTVTITGADGSTSTEVTPVGATLIVDKGDEVAVCHV